MTPAGGGWAGRAERRAVHDAGVLVEACVESAEEAITAVAAGAGRVELCANLVEGGTTPSVGEIMAARAGLEVPIMVMIRPRGGDFLYSPLELEVMLADLEAARGAGADGIVLGLLTADGSIDAARTERLVAAADGLSVTFHRAFDVCRDPLEALEILAGLGVGRILTSGGAATAVEGLELIGRLARAAAGRVGILPAGGIRAANVARVLAVGGIGEVHVHASRTYESPMTWRNEAVAMGRAYEPDEYARRAVDEDAIRGLVEAVRLARG